MRADWKSLVAGFLLFYALEKLLGSVNYSIAAFDFGFSGPSASIVLGILALVITYFLVKD